VKTDIAPFLLKNSLLFCDKSDCENVSEPSAQRFLAESSDKRLSAQYLRPNFQPIYQHSGDGQDELRDGKVSEDGDA